MNFASPYVYFNEENNDSEVDQDVVQVDDDELARSDGLLSSSAQSAAAPAFRLNPFSSLSCTPSLSLRPSPMPVQQQQQQQQGEEAANPSTVSAPGGEGKKKKRKVAFKSRVHTNIVCIKMAALENTKQNSANCQLATGDVTFCGNSNCKAAFSSLSKLTASSEDEDARNWVCEFCSFTNCVELEEEEVPVQPSVNYILEPAEEKEISNEDGLLLFVVDVSGSMCVSQQVSNCDFQLKSANKREQEFASLLQDGDVQLRHQRRREIYVSRLEAVQAAVDDQITGLQKKRPNCRVGLITFSNDVTIIGDGSKTEEVITGDKLNDMEFLQQAGKDINITRTISQSGEDLSAKLFDLSPGGQTALGPALVVAVNMASQCKGSRVILCTDGLANVGVGALDAVVAAQQQQQQQPQPPSALQQEEQEQQEGPEVEKQPDEVDRVEALYDGIGAAAQLAGVTVSVISIADADCRLENLGRVADLSGGDVQKLNALQLTSNFNNILEKPVIATNVQATMLLHSNLAFCKEIEVDVAEEQQNPLQPERKDQDCIAVSRQTKDVGNAFADSEVYFEYEVKYQAKSMLSKLAAVPFQVQINYTQLDGSKCVRIISHSKELTADRKVVAEKADMSILAAHAAKKSAALAQKGLYNQSRVCNFAHSSWMQRNSKSPAQQGCYERFISHAQNWDGMLHNQQREDLMATGLESSTTPVAMLAKGRRLRRSDNVSSHVYRSKSSSSSSFTPSFTPNNNNNNNNNK
mmetsp:Transcript_35531/g.69696  ORF Transcript_35531/g.69696 Transcript_35531/m.69696 type:complete len:750 (+) Transcript_35531:32-2281(+)